MKREKSSREKALITGITGQDASYLAQFLLGKGYEVHGIIRRASTFNTGRIDHLYKDPHLNSARLFLLYGDTADSTNLLRLVYNIQSLVRVSFDIPEYTADVTGLSTIRILEAIREVGAKSKFYQASSSEMFVKVLEVPQRETDFSHHSFLQPGAIFWNRRFVPFSSRTTSGWNSSLLMKEAMMEAWL